ncbi:VolA/Pla-1 family phospholipase [Aliiglaciecola sp. NS0011-25]|uniref:VolA/Pla-1 family phospholipase n=1 Tax=Aliiglaciecola sp. NS0011-25 TaxID=3127654 RepID=UPI0031085660
MKKLLISTSIAAVFVLAGCGGGDELKEIQQDTTKTVPASRIMFDPANSVLNVPSDLFFALVEITDDGTLEMPDEIAGQANGATPDFGNPSAALGALDGWSTQHPFTFSTSHPTGVSLDASSAASAGAVRIFEGAIGGDLNDPDCTTAPPITGCKVGDELTFGVDFITQASGNDVAIIPLKPLKESTSYYVVATNKLTAGGQALKPSTTYELVRQDLTTLPLATDSQRSLQGIINSYEAVLTSQAGLSQDEIIFSYTFTTQSTTQIIDTVKQLQIAPFAQALQAGLSPAEAAAYLPVIPVTEASVSTAFDMLAPSILGEDQLAGLTAVGLNTCDGMISAISDPSSPLFSTAAAVFPQVGAFCAASMKTGSIDLPYYSDPADPLNGRWEAACTNGLALQTLGSEQIATLLANGTISTGPNNDLCQAASGGQLLDLDLSNLGMNDLRHVTRYSPIPARQGSNDDGTETLDVQITVPDANVIAVLAALPNSGVTAISKPESGWPVVILQHGITSKKEDFLAITGALSLAGFATVAIDHPLHGSRGFTIDGQIVNTSTGFGGSTTDYLNLASLLTTRDNNRQSIVDAMGLRLGLNAVVDLTGGSVDLDSSKVSYIGQSLGSITGIPSVASSNKSFGETSPLAAFDSMYAFETAVFNVPGGGTGGFLIESPSFSNLIKGSLLASSSAEFQGYLVEYATENQIPAEQAIIPAFIAYEAQLDEAGLAEINATFASFVFAAQTITDASDPNNFAALLASNSNFMFQEVIGGGTNDDGSTALPDQVIPNSTVNSPTFAGTEPLAKFAGLSGVSTTTDGNGLVRFIAGVHSSLLSPSPSADVTTEMQKQAAAFFATGGTIVVTDTLVVAN